MLLTNCQTKGNEMVIFDAGAGDNMVPVFAILDITQLCIHRKKINFHQQNPCYYSNVTE